MDTAANDPPAGLAPRAAVFEFAVVWATIASAVLLGIPHDVAREEWIAFGILLPLIAVVHLGRRERAKYQGSHLSLAPMFAAVLLLPPLLAAVAIAAAFLPEWLRTRVPWYIAVFNAANFVASGLVASVTFNVVAGGSETSWALGAAAGVVAFLAVQYALLAVMLRLARGVAPRDTVRVDCVLIDGALLALGALGAALVDDHPSLVLLLAVPLALMYRSLEIPSLVEAARIEPKTGLFNMRHFQAVLEQELRRADRFERPLSLLMVDVDHLRNVNTTHGHVGGDRALVLVTATLRAEVREYDIAARFGGDEFCILLPETAEPGALAVAERIRTGVESAGEAHDLPLTVSVGVATVRRPDTSSDELLTLADRAAYRAKFSGRNAVAVAPEGDPVDEAERLLAETTRPL